MHASKLEAIRTHRRLHNSTITAALNAINEGWVAPSLNRCGEPVMSIEDATADKVAEIRKSFQEKGLIALQYDSYACACEGAEKGMPDCSCGLTAYAYKVVRDEVDAQLKIVGIL